MFSDSLRDLPSLLCLLSFFVFVIVSIPKVTNLLAITEGHLDDLLDEEGEYEKASRGEPADDNKVLVLGIELPQPTDRSMADVQTAKQTFLRRLIDNLQERFPRTDLGILEAFSVFDPMNVPPKQAPGSGSYGEPEIDILANHYGPRG